jgi:hypothetical protein
MARRQEYPQIILVGEGLLDPIELDRYSLIGIKSECKIRTTGGIIGAVMEEGEFSHGAMKLDDEYQWTLGRDKAGNLLLVCTEAKKRT